MRDFPTFTDAQVSALEELFPARTIKKGESIEDHRRYAGMVDIVQMLRDHVIDGPESGSIELTEDEEAELAIAEAVKQQHEGDQ